MFSNIHDDFYSKGVSSMYSSSDLNIGRLHGGMAILWRKELDNICRMIDKGDNRIMAAEISVGHTTVLIISVYLPYCCDDNAEGFNFYLVKLNDIINEADITYVYIFGDFNADPTNSIQLIDQSVDHTFDDETLTL